MNKYNIKIIVPILNKNYEIFVPNNILTGNLLYMFTESINDMNNKNIKNMSLYDSITGNKLNLEEYIFNTINNGSILILA